MKTASNNHLYYNLSTSESLMYMEKHEHNHLNQIYEAKSEPLECWGKESQYLDSEFFIPIEKKQHECFLW